MSYFSQIPNWFHFKCFWKRARVGNTSDIYGYDGLRWDDQQKIKEKIASKSYNWLLKPFIKS